MPSFARSWVCAIVLICWGVELYAQSSAAPANEPKSGSGAQAQASQAKSAPTTDREKQVEKQEQSQRLLGVLPNFGTTSRRNPPPLSASGKFHLFYKSAFDPVQLSVVGLQAGFSQAEDEFPEYGQGAAGFGKRYGATLADEVSSGLFTDFLYPVLFKEDPRYFRLGEGPIKRRFGYALLQEIDCHTDKGGRSVAWSNVLGALTSGSVSNAYYPAPERGFGLTMSRSAISIGYGSLGGLVDEFYPDISHRLFHHHDKLVPQP
ncbi:MAG TPA: hypothetical protein VFA90_20515 [Terriglobales bacterium]|nr:hypothetical protein [Terriglobales bacterium]